jgi:hypothetical protein
MRPIGEDGLGPGPFFMMDAVPTPGQTLVNGPAEAVATAVGPEIGASHNPLHGLAFSRKASGTATPATCGPFLLPST